MAVPKRRHSSTRGKKRRTNWKLRMPSRSLCSHRSQPKLPTGSARTAAITPAKR